MIYDTEWWIEKSPAEKSTSHNTREWFPKSLGDVPEDFVNEYLGNVSQGISSHRSSFEKGGPLGHNGIPLVWSHLISNQVMTFGFMELIIQ